MTKYLLDFFKKNEVEIKEGHMLSAISPIRIGGPADIIAYPMDVDSFLKSVSFIGSCNIKYKILGRMSNVLPPDEGYDGVIIRTDRLSDIKIRGSFVEAQAGVSLPLLAGITADHGLSGLEELSGIPGSIGGAVIGNAGAYGREISQLVSSVTVYDTISRKIERIRACRLEFEYRSSCLKGGGLILLSARLDLTRGKKELIKASISKYREERCISQPVGQPSLGSVFKKHDKKTSAGYLIDQCGLKGKTIGGAAISDKHAGFIINKGGASAEDFIRLADYAKETVYQRFGIVLEREIEFM